MGVFVSPCWLDDDWRWGFYYSQCDTMAFRPIRIRLMIFERIFCFIVSAVKCSAAMLTQPEMCFGVSIKPWAMSLHLWLTTMGWWTCAGCQHTNGEKTMKSQKNGLPSTNGTKRRFLLLFSIHQRANVFITKILRKWIYTRYRTHITRAVWINGWAG